jgi:4-amino-4-deoxychorismate lyase
MVLINGRESEVVAHDDRGLSYGDGLFETIACLDGRPFLWDQHIARLQHGCKRLGIPMPSASLLQDEVAKVSDSGRAVAKITITRGRGGRGYICPDPPQPLRIVASHPWPQRDRLAKTGVTLRWCETPLARNQRLAGIKHLNRLEQVLARREWNDETISEGLMSTSDGEVIEGTMSNLFVVHGDDVSTPSLTDCGIAGVMRAALIATLEGSGQQVSIRAVKREDVYHADEVFLSNCIIGIWPVIALADARWPVGALTSRLQSAIKARRLHPGYE